MTIKNVAIFGGNGTVGSLIGAIISGFGEAKVILVCRDIEKIDYDLFMDRIYKSIKSEIIKDRVSICNYDEIKEKLKTCDWILECVAENYETKNSVFSFINENCSEEAIITSCTSGLSLNVLSKNFSKTKRENFFGTHFFNPPYNMTLCEIIETNQSNAKKVKQFSSYLEEKLLRKVIYSKDKPAFIANRIGFKILNDVLLLSEEYKDYGGIDFIDSLFTGYTGRSMKPLETINFVGLDVHKAIVDNIYNNKTNYFEANMITPNYLNKLISMDNLGLKSGKGLYMGDNMVYDVYKDEYREIYNYNHKIISDINDLIKDGHYEEGYSILFSSDTLEMNLVKKVLIEYIVYSIIVAKENSNSILSCDTAMVNGFGWCPPLALKELIEKVCDFNKLVKKYISKDILKRYDYLNDMNNIPKSEYDYKRYIRAK